MLNIGVVGYSSTPFDKARAQEFLTEGLDQILAAFPNREYAIVSGLTDLGIPRLAYLEAVRRGFRTVGIACKKAEEFTRFPVDEELLVGTNWGDESDTFLRRIDTLLRIGGGKQSHTEVKIAKRMGVHVLEFDLPAVEA